MLPFYRLNHTWVDRPAYRIMSFLRSKLILSSHAESLPAARAWGCLHKPFLLLLWRFHCFGLLDHNAASWHWRAKWPVRHYFSSFTGLFLPLEPLRWCGNVCLLVSSLAAPHGSREASMPLRKGGEEKGPTLLGLTFIYFKCCVVDG